MVMNCCFIFLGEGGAEKANSTAPVGIGRGRKNFSRSGASNRRFVDNDGASKSRGHFTNQRKHDENATVSNLLVLPSRLFHPVQVIFSDPR